MKASRQGEESWFKKNIVPLVNLILTGFIMAGGVFVYITYESQRQSLELEAMEQRKPNVKLFFDVTPIAKPNKKNHQHYFVEPKITIENNGKREFEVAYVCLESYFGEIKEWPENKIESVNAFGPGLIHWKKRGEMASCLASKCEEMSSRRKSGKHDMGCISKNKLKINQLAGVYNGEQTSYFKDSWLLEGKDINWIGARSVVTFTTGEKVFKQISGTCLMPLPRAKNDNNVLHYSCD